MPITAERIGTKLERIVLGTDFSPVSANASAFAAALAKRFSSRLTVTNVVDLSVATRSEHAIVGLPIPELHETSNTATEALTEELNARGVRAAGHVLEAHNPALALVNLARDLSADLIVVGTHSRRGLEKFILGSCSEGVIRHATCPVLTVGPHTILPRSETNPFRNVLLATEIVPSAPEMAWFAFGLVGYGGKLCVCRVVGTPEKTAIETIQRDSTLIRELRAVIPAAAYAMCDTEVALEYGDASSTILRVAGDIDADLIVLGARRSASWFTHVRTGTIGRVLAESTCPVLTVGYDE